MAKSNISITDFLNGSFSSKLSEQYKKRIVVINDFLVENDCKVEASTTGMGANGRFMYTQRKNRKNICVMYLENKSFIAIGGNHYIQPNDSCENNILGEMPTEMLGIVMEGSGGPYGANCGTGKCVNPDGSINAACECRHAPADVFIFNDKIALRCKHNPRFLFKIDEKLDFDIIDKWLEYEVLWRPKSMAKK